MNLLLVALLVLVGVLALGTQLGAQAPAETAPSAPSDQAPPAQVTAQLAGDPHTWDNQLLYVSGQVNVPDPTTFALLMKAIIANESGFVEDALGDPQAGNPLLAACSCGTYRGLAGTVNGQSADSAGYCSLGLMQVNRCAHPQLAAQYNLLDGNENIWAGATVLADPYRLYYPDWTRILTAYNGSPAYASRVLPTFQGLAQATGIIV